MRTKPWGCLRFLIAIIFLLTACSGEETPAAKKMPDEPSLGPNGPALGAQAHVVRSVTVQTSGDVSGDFSAAKGDKGTYLSGLCNPESFANFMLALPGGEKWDEIWVTNYSKGRIGTAETGTFKLSWVEVTLRKYAEGNFTMRKYRGPGTMTITTHDANPDHRRMVGTMEGSGLEGMGAATGKKVDLHAGFDMDFSCGIKQ